MWGRSPTFWEPAYSTIDSYSGGPCSLRSKVLQINDLDLPCRFHRSIPLVEVCSVHKPRGSTFKYPGAAMDMTEDVNLGFGPNMTTLTFALSTSIGRELNKGDEILLTTLDHDANFTPWKALEEKGVVVKVVDIREEDCTHDLEDLKSKISRRPRILAVGYCRCMTGLNRPPVSYRLINIRARLSAGDAFNSLKFLQPALR